MALGRDAGVQISERLGVIEPGDLGHHAFEQTGHAVGFGPEGLQLLPPVDPSPFVGTVVKEALHTLRAFRRRQVGKGQKALALEVCAFGIEHGATLAVDEEGDRVREAAFRITGGLVAQRFDEERPAGAQPLQRVVEPGTYGDELGIGRAVEIGAAEPARALQRAVLVEHDPGCDEPRPRQVVREQHAPGSVFAEVEHPCLPFTRRARGRAAAGGARIRR